MTPSRIISNAQGEFTVESLTERLCDEYDVTAEEARSCVTDLLEKLDKEGVIEKYTAEPTLICKTK